MTKALTNKLTNHINSHFQWEVVDANASDFQLRHFSGQKGRVVDVITEGETAAFLFVLAGRRAVIKYS